MGVRRGLGLLVLGLVLVAGCGARAAAPTPARSADGPFAAPRLSWAQGSTIHYGARTLHVKGVVDRLWRSSHGFVVATRTGWGLYSRGSGLSFVDAHGARPLPDVLADPVLSPDGRYLGLVDREGPRRLYGRLAQAVVLDLRTRREVMTSRQGMGGWKDDLDDLYEDAEPTFLGFDDRYAYWRPATGKTRILRARIGVWKVEPGGRRDSFGEEVPRGRLYDGLVGRRTGMADDGRESKHGDGLSGLVSPDGRWCVTTGAPGHLRVVDCRSGKAATPDYPARRVYFGGWLGADDFFVSAQDHGDGATSRPRDDHSRGVLARCSLRTRECRTLVRVRKMDSVVLASGLERL